jgi:hypothetical protein
MPRRRVSRLVSSIPVMQIMFALKRCTRHSSFLCTLDYQNKELRYEELIKSDCSTTGYRKYAFGCPTRPGVGDCFSPFCFISPLG